MDFFTSPELNSSHDTRMEDGRWTERAFDPERPKYENLAAQQSTENLLKAIENNRRVSGEGDETATSSSSRPSPSKKQRPVPLLLLSTLSLALNAVLLVSCIVLFARGQETSPLPPWPTDVYSPAHVAVEYETMVFSSGFGSERTDPRKTVYLGPPTDEGDAAWLALYNDHGLSQISAEEASLLPNATVEVPENPGSYIIGLDVFHQLHCLNRLRRKLYPARYNPEGTSSSVDPEEQSILDEHCINSIRQSLMCNADLSTIYWAVDGEAQNRSLPLPRASTTHTCRKWDRIVDWAKAHRVEAFNGQEAPTIE
ncbi:MAG: hypothetical protein M1819_004025 [Sarea resinae]|nr:MAG: hypothetical protein M1819_004025 [Sarea resinae]